MKTRIPKILVFSFQHETTVYCHTRKCGTAIGAVAQQPQEHPEGR